MMLQGASNDNDERWRRSDYGLCVDMYAPGEGILSFAPSEGEVFLGSSFIYFVRIFSVLKKYLS